MWCARPWDARDVRALNSVVKGLLEGPFEFPPRESPLERELNQSLFVDDGRDEVLADLSDREGMVPPRMGEELLLCHPDPLGLVELLEEPIHEQDVLFLSLKSLCGCHEPLLLVVNECDQRTRSWPVRSGPRPTHRAREPSLRSPHSPYK